MNESEWLTSVDPAEMLEFIRTPYHQPFEEHQVGVSDRKLRLFACACCRAVWDGAPCGRCKGTGKESMPVYGDTVCGGTAIEIVRRAVVVNSPCTACPGTGRIGGLTDPRSRRAVEVAERFADGEATDQELYESHETARAAWNQDISSNPAGLAVYCGHRNPLYAAQRINHPNLKDVPPPATQAALLRAIVGNPFRPVVKPCTQQAWRCDWLTPTVVRLARTIYLARRWDALPILADALLEADCRNQEIIDHLQGPGPHCRGCWYLDILLGLC